MKKTYLYISDNTCMSISCNIVLEDSIEPLQIPPTIVGISVSVISKKGGSQRWQVGIKAACNSETPEKSWNTQLSKGDHSDL